jgi:hypothetical protein
MENKLKIQISTFTSEFSGLNYVADCVDLPGIPPIGLGSTEAEAVGRLILELVSMKETYGRFLNLEIV